MGNFWSGREIKNKAEAMQAINSPAVKTVVLAYPRRVKCGLKTGSSDLIGWKTLTVTPEMVGEKIAVFCSAELKTEKGRPTEDQKNWLSAVNFSGGLAGIVRSMKDFKEIFKC